MMASLVEGSIGALLKILYIVGSVFPHLIHLVADWFIMQSGQVPGWVRTTMSVVDQIAVGANMVAGILSLVSMGLVEFAGPMEFIQKVVRGPLLSAIGGFTAEFMSIDAVTADAEAQDRAILQSGKPEDSITMCYSLGLSGC